jgi:hypothetical protein
MYRRRSSDCTIRYQRDLIVLSGAADAVHVEATRILRRFANSARPYTIKAHTRDRIVLAATH